MEPFQQTFNKFLDRSDFYCCFWVLMVLYGFIDFVYLTSCEPPWAALVASEGRNVN